MSFDASDTGWLLGGRSKLKAAGELGWKLVNTSYRAYLPLTAEGFDDGVVGFCYNVPAKRASEPSLTVSLSDVCIYRLDVNGDHRDGAKMYRGVTHIQRRSRSDQDRMSFEPNPVGIPDVKRHHRVAPEEYRSLLLAFATPIGLDILDVDWVDPPEGRHP